MRKETKNFLWHQLIGILSTSFVIGVTYLVVGDWSRIEEGLAVFGVIFFYDKLSTQP